MDDSIERREREEKKVKKTKGIHEIIERQSNHEQNGKDKKRTE